MNNKIFENYKKDYIRDLKKLVSFKSFLKNIDDYPNIEQKNALKFMSNLAKKENFKTDYSKDGYYGYIEYGKGEKMIGILGHLDVVDPGDTKKWETDPFNLVEKNGYLIGRGTIDDKGPMMLAFYLLKYLKESKIKLNKRVRLIYGTDEETLWRGIAKYIENEELPEMGFTPDATFPAIYGEKALLQWKTEEDFKGKNFKIWGGQSVNAVPDFAVYEGKNIQKIKANAKKHNFDYKIEKNKIHFLGKAEHAMVPEGGINAIQRLAICLEGIVDSKIIKFVANELKEEVNGITLFDKVIKDKTGIITVNLGKLEIKNNKLIAWFDHRIPILITSKEEVESLLKEKLTKYQLEYQKFDFLKSIYADKNSKIIKILMDSYKKITNNFDAQPYTTGGATYARSMENIFAFGPFVKEEINTEHQPNEKMKIQILKEAFEIYKEAIINLSNDDLQSKKNKNTKASK